MAVDLEAQKRRAAMAAAQLVADGMTVGLGTGSTVAYLFEPLAARGLSLRCVATSPETERAARASGLHVEPFTVTRVDIAIDGADQVSEDGWLVKGGGRAHTREKLVAITADRFIVIVDSSKPDRVLHPPVPLELVGFAIDSTLARLEHATLRGGPNSPDGGVIADFTGAIDDPAQLAAWLSATPGVVEHGLFPAAMVSEVLVGERAGVRRIAGAKH